MTSATPSARRTFSIISSRVSAPTETQILPLFTRRILKLCNDAACSHETEHGAKGRRVDYRRVRALLYRDRGQGPGDGEREEMIIELKTNKNGRGRGKRNTDDGKDKQEPRSITHVHRQDIQIHEHRARYPAKIYAEWRLDERRIAKRERDAQTPNDLKQYCRQSNDQHQTYCDLAVVPKP